MSALTVVAESKDDASKKDTPAAANGMKGQVLL